MGWADTLWIIAYQTGAGPAFLPVPEVSVGYTYREITHNLPGPQSSPSSPTQTALARFRPERNGEPKPRAGPYSGRYRAELSFGRACRYRPVVATVAWPSVACTSETSAPRSSA